MSVYIQRLLHVLDFILTTTQLICNVIWCAYVIKHAAEKHDLLLTFDS